MPLISPCHVTQRDIDESIENDIDYKIELARADDQEQLEWVEEGWSE